jgi:uncharacterized protein YegJ (DUF2314 family)
MRKLHPATRAFVIGLVIVVALSAWGIYTLLHLAPNSVVRINRQDPELESAIKEAKKGMDAFIKELQSPKPDERFAVKGMFQTPFGPEYLWVRKPTFENSRFSGVLDQDPMALAGKKKGDDVNFAEKDAVDWMIKDDTETRGAFTEKVLSKR